MIYMYRRHYMMYKHTLYDVHVQTSLYDVETSLYDVETSVFDVQKSLYDVQT